MARRLARGTCFGLVFGLRDPVAGSARSLWRRPPSGSGSRESPVGAAEAILSGQCLSCHGPEQKKGGLDLSRRAALLKGGKSGVVVVPGSPDESTLIDKIADGEMPPKAALAPEQVEAIRSLGQVGRPLRQRAARAAARRRDWWSLQPIRPVVVPPLEPADSAWIRTRSMRSFLHAGMPAALARRPRPIAGRSFRRVSFDLTGSAAGTGSRRRVRRRPRSPRLRGARRSLAGFPAIRRALGPALARRRPVRRERRL